MKFQDVKEGMQVAIPTRKTQGPKGVELFLKELNRKKFDLPYLVVKRIFAGDDIWLDFPQEFKVAKGKGSDIAYFLRAYSFLAEDLVAYQG